METALIIRDQVITLLQKGGFVLKKWASNNKKLLKDTPNACYGQCDSRVG